MLGMRDCSEDEFLQLGDEHDENTFFFAHKTTQNKKKIKSYGFFFSLEAKRKTLMEIAHVRRRGADNRTYLHTYPRFFDLIWTYCSR